MLGTDLADSQIFNNKRGMDEGWNCLHLLDYDKARYGVILTIIWAIWNDFEKSKIIHEILKLFMKVLTIIWVILTIPECLSFLLKEYIFFFNSEYTRRILIKVVKALGQSIWKISNIPVPTSNIDKVDELVHLSQYLFLSLCIFCFLPLPSLMVFNFRKKYFLSLLIFITIFK